MLDCTRVAPDGQEAAIRRLAATHDVFEVRGWRAAERNLDFFVVWAARLLHGQGGRYFTEGGIEGVVARALDMPDSAWRVVARTNSLGGAVVIIRVKKFSDSPSKKLDSNAGLT